MSLAQEQFPTFHPDYLKYVFVKKYLSSIFTITHTNEKILMPLPTPLTSGQKAPPFSYVESGSIISSTEITSPHLIYFYPKVKPEAHAAQVLEDLSQLTS